MSFLIILCLNVCTSLHGVLKNKLSDLHYTIYQVNAPNVILICESWLNETVTNGMIGPQYLLKSFLHDRTDKMGGGGNNFS